MKSSGDVEAGETAMIGPKVQKEAAEESQVYDKQKHNSVVCPRLESARPGLLSLNIAARSVPEKIDRSGPLGLGPVRAPVPSL